MGWFAIYEALKHGSGGYGTVREALRGEIDPGRSLAVALDAVAREMVRGEFLPNARAKKRIAYWARKNGYDLPRPSHETKTKG